MAIATILTASRGGVLSFAAASGFALATFVFKAKKVRPKHEGSCLAAASSRHFGGGPA
jgi:hypothetical protein